MYYRFFPCPPRFFFFLFLLASLVQGLSAQNTNSKTSNFTPYIALSYQPFSFWSFTNTVLDLDMDSSFFTRVEFDITHRSGIKFGINIDFTRIPFTKTDTDDNFIDKFGNIMGKLGYNDFIFLVSNSRIAGTGYWYGEAETEDVAVSQPGSFGFDNSYFGVDVVYMLWGVLGVGINYIRFSLPFELDPYCVYDPQVTFPTYGITLWVDHFYVHMQERNYGWHFWIEDLSHINFGKMELSKAGKARFYEAREKYAKKKAERGDDMFETGADYDSPYVILIQIDLSIGASYVFKNSNAGIAFGYGIMGQILAPIVDAFAFQMGLRHGFVIKGSYMF